MARRIKHEFPGVTSYFDRHQKRRYRFRKKGFSTEIHSEYGSSEFRRNYERAISGHRSREIGSPATKRGTINALIVSYYKSPEFISLGDSTKATYRREIERLRNEHGHRLVAQMKRAHVVKLLEPLSDRPSARNNRLRMLRMLLNHAVEIGWRSDNPTSAIKKMRTGSQGLHTWTEAEIETFLNHHPIGSTAHTAVTLMLHTACSRVDAVRLGWQNVKGARIQYRRQKTERFSEVVVDIPIHPDLKIVLDALPKSQMTFLETPGGRSRSSNGLGNAMRKWCNAAGLTACSSHGLRKACATRLAESGASEREIMAWTGHSSPQMVQIYAGKARRGLMADQGFAKLLQNETGSKNDEPNNNGSTK
ncbi:tyrosine-type recombinase/integrase [Shimia thalassica]|uniref:tyrosine-type recombinase/integrase n=1 Tax=Shimia thalassica TaxID=1715693 RepID=UPI0027371C03|nr:tyrosine-type recombinase/integrase [Shimia thalassica]MDP2579150.1 tyrosine-type recombinase/integrase [Shimia thalassica]